MSLTALVDYDSGNLHSAQKAFERMAHEAGHGTIVVTSEPDVVAKADRIVLPGDGAYPSCKAALLRFDGLFEAIEEAVTARAVPFMGICIGMQMMSTRGLEFEPTEGFGWVPGEVVKIDPADPTLKVPHMGWNDLVIDNPHPVLEGITTGDHAYFVHSYHLAAENPEDVVATVDYGGPMTAFVANGNKAGAQFHPEKSQTLGLALISNFLRWKP